MEDVGLGLEQTISNLLDEGLDDEEIREKILAAENLEELLRTHLNWIIGKIRRRKALRLERDVIGPALDLEQKRRRPPKRTLAEPEAAEDQLDIRPTSTEERRLFVSSKFALPDGRYVEWMLATPEEHRMRAKWQRNQATTCGQDALRHEQAADLIEARGVTCLADLETFGAP